MCIRDRFNVLLQVLDDGHITDSTGRAVSYTHLFKKFLVIYASALVVIIAVALVLLYGLLKDYEAGRPANTMDKLV